MPSYLPGLCELMGTHCPCPDDECCWCGESKSAETGAAKDDLEEVIQLALTRGELVALAAGYFAGIAVLSGNAKLQLVTLTSLQSNLLSRKGHDRLTEKITKLSEAVGVKVDTMEL